MLCKEKFTDVSTNQTVNKCLGTLSSGGLRQAKQDYYWEAARLCSLAQKHSLTN
jgi:hypothetical protein